MEADADVEVVSGCPIMLPSVPLEQALTSTPCFFHQATKSPVTVENVEIDGHTVPAAVMVLLTTPSRAA
jgi:hypothetical protein